MEDGLDHGGVFVVAGDDGGHGIVLGKLVAGGAVGDGADFFEK